MFDWKQTKLWQLLSQGSFADSCGSSASRLVNHLELMMPDIVAVLSSGETSPSDFTLHDEGHGFRVAERMVDVLTPSGTSHLSPTEAALLLLSAHLHDIGMTPKRGKVRVHREYLLTGASSPLVERERAELQLWLDDHAGGLVPPLTNGPVTVNELRRADLLMTHYARSRHNDWSEEWIRDQLSSRPELYAGWIDDLVQLCRSHHYGYEELVKEKFDPKLVGPSDPPELVHLRFLAAALRIADILEFDPERTPEVILQHRDVSPGSVLYWEKDHQVALVRRGNTLIFQARPSKAAIHRAIETMADDIDAELELCLRLKNENRFGSAALGPSYPILHQWTLEKMHRNIVPRENSYEYVNGSFRPNTARILQLLSGTALYQNPLAATRELLQNAFDAVQEKIAWQRLIQTNSASRELERVLGEMNAVILDVKQDAEGTWLECTDSGIGMSKNVLTNQFLVSGSPRSHKLLDLERRCRVAGFELGRTGEFGIGALSYFIISDRVAIETRRSQEAGDLELNAWCFTTDGIGSFGELRRIERPPGTTVRLRLRPEIVSRLDAWIYQLEEYLGENILITPCRLELRRNSVKLQEWPVGWVDTPDVLSERLLSGFEILDPDLSRVSSVRREKLIAAAKSRAESVRMAREALQWQFWEMDIPGGLGRCRVSLPWFELPQGRSLIFQRLQSGGQQFKILDETSLDREPRHCWKGILANVQSAESSSEYVDGAYETVGWIKGVTPTWNWISPTSGQVSISRSALSLSTDAAKMIAAVRESISNSVQQWVESSFGPSPFLARSSFEVGSSFRLGAPVWWKIASKNSDKEILAEVPVIAQALGEFKLTPMVRWCGRLIPVAAQTLARHSTIPHFVLPVRAEQHQLVAIWDFPINHENGKMFPKAWDGIAAFMIGSNLRIGNPTHAVGRQIGWLRSSPMGRGADPVAKVRILVADRAVDRLIEWFLSSAWYGNGDDWLVVAEQDPVLAADAWHLLSSKDRKDGFDRLAFADVDDEEIIVFAQQGVQMYHFDSDDGRALMPDPGPEWDVELVD